jgi:hypothetical protein
MKKGNERLMFLARFPSAPKASAEPLPCEEEGFISAKPGRE